MKTFTYKIHNDEIRNLEKDQKTLEEMMQKLDPPNTIVELDFSEVENPVVSMSTAITFKRILGAGFPKIIVKGHKNKKDIEENPAIKLMITADKVEIK